MKLLVKHAYKCREIAYAKGSTIEVDPLEAEWLMADSPGCFSEYEEPVKAVKKPVKDKQVKRAKKDK